MWIRICGSRGCAPRTEGTLPCVTRTCAGLEPETQRGRGQSPTEPSRNRTGAPRSPQRTWAENEMFRLLFFFPSRMNWSILEKQLWASPIVFGPGTPVRTWGTRPVLLGSFPSGSSHANTPQPVRCDQLLGGPPRRVSSPRLRPGSTLGLGLGAFFVSRLPLSLLPMEPNITRMAGHCEMQPHHRRRKP